MVSKFTCETCLKTFKTTQHLNQHKNRKKKCQPCIKDDNISLNITPNITSNNLFDLNQITSGLLNTNTNNNNILSISNLIELIVKLKTSLNENKHLEELVVVLKANIQKLTHENIILKKKMLVVQKFMEDITCVSDNEDSYISSLSDSEATNQIKTPELFLFPKNPEVLPFTNTKMFDLMV